MVYLFIYLFILLLLINVFVAFNNIVSSSSYIASKGYERKRSSHNLNTIPECVGGN